MSLVPIEHTPVAPPRPCTPGEGIYLKLWCDFVAARPDDFEHIFYNMNDPIDQRAATVAASFMVYMGCNGGASFTAEAARMAGVIRNERDAYLAAWAIENARTCGLNCGLRTIEYMLAPVHPIEQAESLRHGVNWALVPDVTMRDMDVIECMVVWWSSLPARQIRDIAEAMIVGENRKRLSGLFTKAEATQS